MASGMKKSKAAYNKLILGKSGGHGTKTKGVTKKGPQGPTGHKAPSTTKGNGKAMRSKKTKHGSETKGKSMTHGRG